MAVLWGTIFLLLICILLLIAILGFISILAILTLCGSFAFGRRNLK